MPVLSSPPALVGGAGAPVNGRVLLAPTEEYTHLDETVLVAPQAGVIRQGQFYAADGVSPLEVVPTPEGIGMRIELYLEVLTGSGAREYRVARTVVIPDTTYVSWAYLDDFAASPPPVGGGTGEGFGLGGFGTSPFGL